MSTRTVKQNATIMRFKIDILVAAPTRKKCEGALRIRGHQYHLRSLETITIRGEDGWVNPAWRVKDSGKSLTVEPKRKRKDS